MVVQALVAPGDIVIVDRNCHKSHHYGMVLGGGQPLYVEAFPLTQFSMYGAVPLSTIKKALLDLRAEGRLDRVRMLDLTNVQHAPRDGGMPCHQAGPHLPLG
jgi:arginine decarboxylase